jgi:hypothetical protein
MRQSPGSGGSIPTCKSSLIKLVSNSIILLHCQGVVVLQWPPGYLQILIGASCSGGPPHPGCSDKLALHAMARVNDIKILFVDRVEGGDRKAPTTKVTTVQCVDRYPNHVEDKPGTTSQSQVLRFLVRSRLQLWRTRACRSGCRWEQRSARP